MNLNRNKFLLALGTTVIVLGVLVILRRPISSFVARSEDSEALMTLTAYGNAERNYFANHNEYSSDESKIGYKSELPDISVFFAKAAVPEKYKKVLNESNLPRMEKNSYQILLSVDKKGRGVTEFWNMDESGRPSKLIPNVPLFPR